MEYDSSRNSSVLWKVYLYTLRGSFLSPPAPLQLCFEETQGYFALENHHTYYLESYKQDYTQLHQTSISQYSQETPWWSRAWMQYLILIVEWGGRVYSTLFAGHSTDSFQHFSKHCFFSKMFYNHTTVLWNEYVLECKKIFVHLPVTWVIELFLKMLFRITSSKKEQRFYFNLLSYWTVLLLDKSLISFAN